MKNFHFVQSPLVNDDSGGEGNEDRGDNFVPTEEKQAKPSAEEAALAQGLKDKAATDAAAKEKAEADAAAAKEKTEKSEGDEEEDDPDNPGKKRPKDTRIPLNRHKALIEAERAERAKLEAKLAQYQRSDDIAETNEVISKAEDTLIKLETEHSKLTQDGKADEAAKVMTKIRHTERDIMEAKMELKAAATEARAYERARYDITVDRIEEAYPVLKKGAEEYDALKVKKVLSISRAYQIDGYTPAAALQEAVKDLLGEPVTRDQKTAIETTARVDEAAKKKAERDEAARQKAAAAAEKTPSTISKEGKNSDALGGSLSGADVLKMTQEDFNKLGEAELSRLRGDIPE